MWDKLEPDLIRLVGSTACTFYGRVAFKLDYVDNTVYFILYDKPIK